MTMSTTGHKQWVHATISSPRITLVANFSTLAGELDPCHRLTTLVFTDAVAGHVQACAAQTCRAAPWQSSIRFAASHMIDTGDGFELVVDEPALELHAELRLHALASPSTLHNLRIGGGVLHWAVVPRLLASGKIAYRGSAYEIRDAPAYRDRNWGVFEFGGVVWDWGYVLPDRPDCELAVVFARMLDVSRTRVFDQHALVWAGRSLLGSFRGDEIAFAPDGRASGPFPTVPAVLALCRPGHASDIPQRLTVAAASARGRLTVEFTRAATARVVVPNDAGLGTTAIHESLGRAHARGHVDGVPIELTGHGFVEAVHA
jgi:hypothetical protein